MPRFCLRVRLHPRTCVVILVALLSAGCKDQTTPTPSPAPKASPSVPPATAIPAAKSRPAEEAAEPVRKPDPPADVAALKADGASVKTNAAGNVVSVNLASGNGTDATLSHLKALPALQELTLSGPSYTPEALSRLGELSTLTRLSLEATNTNNSVLGRLRSCPSSSSSICSRPTCGTTA